MRTVFLLMLVLGVVSAETVCSKEPRSQVPSVEIPETPPIEKFVPIGNPLPPQGKKLPRWFVVTVEQAKWWGAADYRDEISPVRVTFDNRSEQEINLLNLEFFDTRFVVLRASGHKSTIPVELGRGDCLWINPQMIIGPKSRVSFDVDFKHPSRKSFGAGARFRSEANMCFWMRDYLDRGKPQSFEYTIPFSVVDVPETGR